MSVGRVVSRRNLSVKAMMVRESGEREEIAKRREDESPAAQPVRVLGGECEWERDKCLPPGSS